MHSMIMQNEMADALFAGLADYLDDAEDVTEFATEEEEV